MRNEASPESVHPVVRLVIHLSIWMDAAMSSPLFKIEA
jgi:hypothetical protein